jgi:hypothetical protein
MAESPAEFHPLAVCTLFMTQTTGLLSPRFDIGSMYPGVAKLLLNTVEYVTGEYAGKPLFIS